ncbi:MAG: RNA-guided endonuclease InsQ/TnpB family protein [Acidimicrobiales bacterium]
MIASSKRSLKVGSAHLVVDGTDESLVRQVTIALSPGRVMSRKLDHLEQGSRDVYNASLEHRRDAWRMAKVSLSRIDQFNEIPGLVSGGEPVMGRFTRYGSQWIRGSMTLADEAFGAFFRRCRAGESPGYPRFKSKRRFRTVFYPEPCGWRLKGLVAGPGATAGAATKGRAALYVQGIGDIALSKPAARQLTRYLARGGKPRRLVLTRTGSGARRATITFCGVAPRRLPGSEEVGGLDRGVRVAAALPDGTLLCAPGFSREAARAIAELQRERAGHQVGSPPWRKLNRAIAKAHHQARCRSENWARHTAIEVVARYGVISMEDLRLSNMTKSARGTKEAPGTNVKAKAGLNRSLGEAALGRLAHWICVKAEEAGRRVWKVDPANSSRQCALCGHTERANRHHARFSCLRCQHTEHADVNAAQVLTARGREADAAWIRAGAPRLVRPVPRMRRRRATEPMVAVGTTACNDEQYGAGLAPHAAVT